MNPYADTSVVELQQERKSDGIRVMAIAWCFGFFYPLIAVVLVYFCWLLGWILLGHRPRPSIDDPKYIGGAMDFVYNIGLLLVVLLPPMSVGGLALAILCPIRSLRERRFGKLVITLANAFMFYCVWELVKLDPGRVFEWFFD